MLFRSARSGVECGLGVEILITGRHPAAAHPPVLIRLARTRVSRPAAEIIIERIVDRAHEPVDAQMLVERLVDVKAEVRLTCVTRRTAEERAAPPRHRIASRTETVVLVVLLELVAALDVERELLDRKSTRLNSSHTDISRMPSSA